jgi:hypothetical protein
LTLKAIYSRSQTSAEALAAKSNDEVDVYFDNPASEGRSLADLLKRADIAAVVVCVPIVAQPVIIKQALAAGKHVLSEKPIAKDVATALELIDWHKELPKPPIWAVGENLRYVDVVVYGAEQLRQVGGDVTTFSMKMFSLVDDKDKFYNTDCEINIFFFFLYCALFCPVLSDCAPGALTPFTTTADTRTAQGAEFRSTRADSCLTVACTSLPACGGC